MSHSIRKFIAVLMSIWLPLFGSSALAASVSMLMPQDTQMAPVSCHDMAMEEMDVQMSEQIASTQVVDSNTSPEHNHQSASCSTCGVCHLAYSGYLAVPEIRMLPLPQAGKDVTPYQFSFRSTHPNPLLPPPLARV